MIRTVYLMVFAMFITTFCQGQSCYGNYSQYFYRLSPPSITGEPYDLRLFIDQSDSSSSMLVVSMALDDFSYFVSPLDTLDFMGALRVKLNKSEYVKLGESFIEMPTSTATTDTFRDKPAHFVDQSTIYMYPLEISTTDDFESTGSLSFVIEPLCTMEEWNFNITQTDGKISVDLRRDGC